MKRISQWFVLLALCVSYSAMAQEDFLQRLQSIETMSGEFKQTITDADGEEVADATVGHFSLQRPGNFYWETLPPYQQIVLMNDNGLMVYDPDLEQVSLYNGQEFANSPAAVLSGDIQLIGSKYSIESKSEKKRHTYLLKEKNIENKTFESLRFTFKNHELVSMALEDQLGQVTKIEFRKVKTNKAIDTKLFDFSPPDDVDVIVSQ